MIWKVNINSITNHSPFLIFQCYVCYKMKQVKNKLLKVQILIFYNVRVKCTCSTEKWSILILKICCINNIIENPLWKTYNFMVLKFLSPFKMVGYEVSVNFKKSLWFTSPLKFARLFNKFYYLRILNCGLI